LVLVPLEHTTTTTTTSVFSVRVRFFFSWYEKFSSSGVPEFNSRIQFPSFEFSGTHSHTPHRDQIGPSGGHIQDMAQKTWKLGNLRNFSFLM
jgi:hypothetical protein